MKPHIFHPDAGEEYARAVEYYAGIAPEPGIRLYDEIERHIREVCRRPDRFFRFSPPAHRALARKFPYSVVYLDTIPPGANIYLNGRKVQSSASGGQKTDARTPMIIPDLPVGAFNMLLTRQGYQDHQELVRLGTSDIKAVKVRLKPR